MSSEVTHLQICGSGCAPRSPRPSRKPTSSCSPPGPHCPWIAVGKRNLRGDRQQAARSRQHLRVAKPAIQGACPGRRYCPCDRHGQRDDPSEISGLARHGLHVVVIEGEALVALPAPSPLELAEMNKVHLAAGDKKAGIDAPWQKIKVDRQIISIAKVAGAKTIYITPTMPRSRQPLKALASRSLECTNYRCPLKKTMASTISWSCLNGRLRP